MCRAMADTAGGFPRPFLTRHRWMVMPVTFCLFAIFAFLSVDVHHDTLMLKSAIDVASGKALFRDSFNQYGFLTSLLQGLTVSVFGGELLVIKLLTVLFYAFSAYELDRLWERFLSPPFRWVLLALFWLLPPFYLVVMHPWSSVYALYFMLLAGNRLLDALESGQSRPLFESGLAAGLAFGCRQPCGLVLPLAAILALALEAWVRRNGWRNLGRRFGFWCAGFGSVLALFALYLTIYGAWQDYIQQCFGFVLRFAWERGGSGASASLREAFLPGNGFLVFPLATLGLFLFSLRKLYRREETTRYLPLAAVLLIGLASYHQFYPVPCVRHLYWASVPMLGALALILQFAWRSRLPKPARLALLLFLAAWPLWEAGCRMQTAAERLYYLRARKCSPFPGLRGVMLHPQEYAYYARVSEAFRKVPPEFQERPYLNLTPDAVFWLFFPEHTKNQPTVHPLFVYWKGVYPNYEETMLKFVRENLPVVVSPTPQPFPEYRPVAGFPSHNPVYFLSIPPF